MKILIVIPARGGPKGITKKNIRFIGGQYLLAYAINCAWYSGYNMDVAVNSDEEEIQNTVKKLDAQIINCPAELADKIGQKDTMQPEYDINYFWCKNSFNNME